MEFGEWMRIRDGLKKAENEAKRREKKILEQQALHEMSKSLVKNWENTIEVWPTSWSLACWSSIYLDRVKD